MSFGREECPARETLYAFVEGDLEPSRGAEVTAHAEKCPDCRSAILDATQSRNAVTTLQRHRLNQRDLERIRRWTARTLDALGEAGPVP